MSLTTNEVIIRQLEEQLADYANDLNAARAQAKKLRSCLSTIAEKVCDSEYGKNQLSGKNAMTTLDDMALRDFIIKNVLQQKIRFTKNIVDLQKTYLNEQKEKDEIAKQLLAERKEKEEYKRAYDNLIKAKEENERQQMLNPAATASVQTFHQTSSAGIIPENSFDSFETGSSADLEMTDKKEEEKTDSNMVYYNKMPYDIDEIYNMVDVYQMKILQIIGENGFSETNDIVDKAAEVEGLGSHTVIRDVMKTMVQNMLLEAESISTPIRRKLTLYSMTPIGIAVFKKEFGRKPIKDEKTRIREMHATLQHGYCIKDTAKILGDLGYTNICMDSTKNAIEVANNRRYVPDIVANFDAKTKTYWEVELGHHKDQDFFEKMEKAAKVTSTVYIVVNDMQSWDKLKKQITGFKLKLKQEHRTIKLTVVLGTMTQLSKKDVFFNNSDNKFVLG